MKDVFIFMWIFIILCCTHLFVYRKAHESGRHEVEAEIHQSSQAQAYALIQAKQKILDLQRVISNNNDECFNRVWPDEIIRAVNVY